VADLRALAAFYKSAIVEKPELARNIAKLFSNTDKSNALTQLLFGSRPGKLHRNPTMPMKEIDPQAVHAMVKKLIDIDKQLFNPTNMRGPEYFSRKLFLIIVGKPFKKSTSNALEEGILQFLVAVEAGVDAEEIIKKYEAISDANEGSILKKKAMEDVIGFLQRTSDIPEHFNYIRQREQNLHALETYLQQSRLFEPQKSLIITPAVKEPMQNQDPDVIADTKLKPNKDP
jgi:hypothetical protein